MSIEDLKWLEALAAYDRIEHHPVCATHRGLEYYCDCILWDGTHRFPRTREIDWSALQHD